MRQRNKVETTQVVYRVRPEYIGYSPEDFETIEEAIERCNYRNSVRERTDEYDEGTFYKGANCKIQKVTVIIEELTF